jgi:hypothetical protein
MFERIVLTASFPVSSIMLVLGLAGLLDSPSDIPYYMAVLLCGLYAALALPLPSSFFTARPSGPALGGGAGSSVSNGGRTGSPLVGGGFPQAAVLGCYKTIWLCLWQCEEASF